MNILLLGNGFDVAHGLPTQYNDFLRFISNYKSFSSHNTCDPLFRKFFTDYFDEQYRKEFDTCLKDNMWLDYFFLIFEDRLSVGKDRWIDFENEISFIVQALDAADDYFTVRFEAGYPEAVLEFKEWRYLGLLLFKETDYEKSSFHRFTIDSIPKIKYDLEHDLDRLIRALELYLSCYVSYYLDSGFREEKAHCDFSKMNISFLINFNYTNTYTSLYRNPNKHISQCHVHGSASQEHPYGKTNMVLGIDEYLDDVRKDSDNRFYTFKKFYQRIMKDTDTSYQNVLQYIETLEPDPNDKEGPYHYLYIFGHSLDVTDKDILSSLILAPNVNTFIYYHNDDSKKNLIGNLMK